ncbi:MAG: ATP-binding protein, partial [Nitrospinaceae bacterium]|nr:ATP-binding protein [Nitrospinaceae bacterium]
KIIKENMADHVFRVHIVGMIFQGELFRKDQGEGTGLGLSIIHKMVSKYGGQIDIQSPMGNGAIFNITFPQSV